MMMFNKEGKIKIFILAVAMLSSVQSAALTAREAEVERARQAHILRQQQLAALNSGADGSTSTSGGFTAVGGSTDKFAAPTTDQRILDYRALHCPDTDFTGSDSNPDNDLDSSPNQPVSLMYPNPQYPGFFYCKNVYCDADLDHDNKLDIDEAALEIPGGRPACDENIVVSGDRPHQKDSCIAGNGVWTVSYSETGSGYIWFGDCRAKTERNIRDVFNSGRYQCNIPDLAARVTVVASVELQTCELKPEFVQIYENHNGATVPDLSGVIAGRIHVDCLHAFNLYRSSSFSSLCFRDENGVAYGFGEYNLECVKNAAQGMAGSFDIDGAGSGGPVSCQDQITSYLEFTSQCGANPSLDICRP